MFESRAELGCGPRTAALVALGYGLATPAYAYATLSVGHQASAFALLSAFSLLWIKPNVLRDGLAGFLASFAVLIEPQVAPIAAILGVYLIIELIIRRIDILSVASFSLGAIGPIAAWLVYNNAAFGGPFEMGYFHHANPRFARSFGGPSARLADAELVARKGITLGASPRSAHIRADRRVRASGLDRAFI